MIRIYLLALNLFVRFTSIIFRLNNDNYKQVIFQLSEGPMRIDWCNNSILQHHLLISY